MHILAMSMLPLVSQFEYVGQAQVLFVRTSQVIGWEEHLQNDVFYVEWDVNPLMHNVAKMVT